MFQTIHHVCEAYDPRRHSRISLVTFHSPLQGLDVDVHPAEADFWAGRMGEM